MGMEDWRWDMHETRFKQPLPGKLSNMRFICLAQR